MQWDDTGILIHTRPLGESSLVVSLLTAQHGRASGIFRMTKKNRGWLQLGTSVSASWRARLETQLGQWQLEPTISSAALLFDHPGKLAALSSACALCQLLLPEGHVYSHLYDMLKALLEGLHTEDWAHDYILFEKELLTELGYGLDLSACAVTGAEDGLVAVSPKTGRAVCAEVAAPYEDKLLVLPLFFLKNAEITLQDIRNGLQLTGYFLERFAFAHTKTGVPPARNRLLAYLGVVKEKTA